MFPACFSLGGRTFPFCFGFCLALEGFCIFSSPRMDRFLVFSTTDFFRSVSRHGCISSLYVRACLSPSLPPPPPPSSPPLPYPPKMTETTGFLLCHWDLSATGLFPAKPKDSVVPQRGDAVFTSRDGVLLGRDGAPPPSLALPSLPLLLLLSIWGSWVWFSF